MSLFSTLNIIYSLNNLIVDLIVGSSILLLKYIKEDGSKVENSQMGRNRVHLYPCTEYLMICQGRKDKGHLLCRQPFF